MRDDREVRLQMEIGPRFGHKLVVMEIGLVGGAVFRAGKCQIAPGCAAAKRAKDRGKMAQSEALSQGVLPGVEGIERCRILNLSLIVNV
jgi:hypothetical protein